MAVRTFGGRWRNIRQLSGGGQGDVFVVEDTSGVLSGEFALKRVRTKRRDDRFRNEVMAVKSLAHPNIVPLVDHSALDGSAAGQSYMVMQLAAADLGQRDRYSLYKGTLDAVIQVATQLASALAFAHSRGVIHRDVKPRNVLFTGDGHFIWLADFGICLIRENERHTVDGEVVGPRNFIAPELEDAGVAEVTAAADIYSLGKVIFFMLSGGVEMPREKLDELPYSGYFGGGQRDLLVQQLLRRMICALPSRITTMDEVLSQLKVIGEWSRRASVPVTAAGLGHFQRLGERVTGVKLASEENAKARESEQATRIMIAGSFTGWLGDQLAAVRAMLEAAGLTVRVDDTTEIPNSSLAVQLDDSWMFCHLQGKDLIVHDTTSVPNCFHILQFSLCERRPIQEVYGYGDTSIRPERDLELGLVPLYRRVNAHEHPANSTERGWLTSKGRLGGLMGNVNRERLFSGDVTGAVSSARNKRVSNSFSLTESHYIQFKASEWPYRQAEIETCLRDAVELFGEYIGG